jgi:hypothetical protein|tara:strand:- start:871 stop:1128 length:258 start_codon:yes stop_codon:yes gene_type:complete
MVSYFSLPFHLTDSQITTTCWLEEVDIAALKTDRPQGLPSVKDITRRCSEKLEEDPIAWARIALRAGDPSGWARILELSGNRTCA